MRDERAPRIPAHVLPILDTLWAAGHAAYVVGGGVRDALLGRPATTGTGHGRAAGATPGALPGGHYENRFGTVTVPVEPVGRSRSRPSGATSLPRSSAPGRGRLHRFARGGPRPARLHRQRPRLGPARRASRRPRDRRGERVSSWSIRPTAAGPRGAAPARGGRSGRALRRGRPAPAAGCAAGDPARLRDRARHAGGAARGRPARRIGLAGAGRPGAAQDAGRAGTGARPPHLEETGLLAPLFPLLAGQVGLGQQKGPGVDLWEHTLRTAGRRRASVSRRRDARHGRPAARLRQARDVGGRALHRPRRGRRRARRALLRRLAIPRREAQPVVDLVRWHMFGYESRWSDGAVRRFLRRSGARRCHGC